jgi:hypothetical protein
MHELEVEKSFSLILLKSSAFRPRDELQPELRE